MSEKHKCAGMVWHDVGFGKEYPCKLIAKHQEDDKWWCKKHLPSEIKRRSDEKSEQWDAEMEKSRSDFRKLQAHDRLSRLAALVPELVEAGDAYTKERWVYSASWGEASDADRADKACEKLEEVCNTAREAMKENNDDSTT